MTKLIDITGKAVSGEWGMDDESGDGTLVLRTTNFTNNGVVDYTDVVTRNLGKKDISGKYLKHGDIIIEKSGGSDNQPVGRVIFFEGPENTYLFNNFTGLLRVKDQERWFPRYVFYALFENYRRGGTKPFENRTTGLHNLQTESYVSMTTIPNVDISTQKEMCETLDRVLNIIEARKSQIRFLDQFIKARFVEMFGDPMTNAKGYELKKYGDVFELNAGGTPSKTHPEYWEGGTISWIGSNMCQDRYIYENDGKYITQEGYDNSSARLFPIDTVLVALVGATIGKTALLKFETTTNQNVLGIRGIRESGYLPEFVYYYTQGLYKKFIGISDGGFSMASKGFISELPIPVVPLALQEEFTSFADQVDKSKVVVQKVLDEAQLLFDSLIQKYFG